MTVSTIPPIISVVSVTSVRIDASWTGAEGAPRTGANFWLQRILASTSIVIEHTGESPTLTGSSPNVTFTLSADTLPGSVSLRFSDLLELNWSDVIDDGQGALTGTNGSSGTINYVTGACVIDTPYYNTCFGGWIAYDPGATWTLVNFTIPINQSAYSVTGLTASTSYHFRIRKYDDINTGPWGIYDTAATLSSETPPPTPDPDIGTIYRIYDGSSTARSGTITLNGTTEVVGSGTSFNTEFVVGDVIEVNGEARLVASISGSLLLTVGTAFAQSASGQEYSGYHIVRVTSLATDMLEPASTPQTYSASRALLDGTVRGMGWAITEWKWGFLLVAQRNALKALCPGKSVSTFIDTRDEADTFVTYRAVMVWQDRPEIFANRWLNFVLQFRKMEAV